VSLVTVRQLIVKKNSSAMHQYYIFLIMITHVMCHAESQRRPNIILVLADDLGICEIKPYSCVVPEGHNQPPISTPNLIKFAQEGLKFTNSYAGAPICASSRCTLMTGKHSGHSTIRGNKDFHGGDWPLEANDTTVAETLKSAGYYTAIIGKWGLGDLGTTGWVRNHGFDYYYGISDQNYAHNYYPDYVFENENQIPLPLNQHASRIKCMNQPLACNYSHDLFTDQAFTLIKNRTIEYPEQPFFLYLAWTLPHAGGWRGFIEDGEPVPSNEPFSNTNWPNVEKDHAAMISSYLDRDFGRLMMLLKELMIDNDTLVWFASDNGAHNEGGHSYRFFNSTGPFRGYKRSLYEGGIRTPQIIRWPNVIVPNTQTDIITMFADFLPTVAELAAAQQLPSDIDGISIVPTLLNKTVAQVQHPYIYFEFCTQYEWGNAVRYQNWKMVRFSIREPYQLFDLDKDIGESNDLSQQYPDLLNLLTMFAEAAHTDSEPFPIKNCSNSIMH
jgi:arylsulfatase A-like enzyme